MDAANEGCTHCVSQTVMTLACMCTSHVKCVASFWIVTCLDYFVFPLSVRQHSHLSAWPRSEPAPPPVKLLQCVLVLLRPSHTHHQDLLVVRRLAHHEGVVLQVRQGGHQCDTAAAPPPHPLPQQGSSQQHGAHWEEDGGGERRPGWTAGCVGRLLLWTLWNNHWPGRM